MPPISSALASILRLAKSARSRPGTFLAATVVIASLLGGCAGSGLSPADKLLRSKDFDGAVAAYEAEEEQHPEDPKVKRNLGVAFLRTGNIAAAILKLDEAQALDPKDPRIDFFMAEARESTADYLGAIEAYAQYLSKGGRDKAAVRRKMQELTHKQAADEVAKALASEGDFGQNPQPNTLAVPDFSNVIEDEDLAPMSKGLAAIVITDLRKVERFRILERQRINVLNSELRLAQMQAGGTGTTESAETSDPATAPRPTGKTMVDEDTAPVIGRIIGAETFVQGLFTPVGSNIQLDANLIGVASGETRSTGDAIEDELERVLYAEKKLVYQILAALGVKPTDEERKEIDKMATDNFAAFMAFCRAIYLEELGLYDESREAFEEVLDQDEDFGDYIGVEDHVTDPEGDFTDLDEDEFTDLTEAPGDSTDDDFIVDVGVGVGEGPPPDDNEDDGAEFDWSDNADGNDISNTDTDKYNPDLGTIPTFPPPPATGGN